MSSPISNDPQSSSTLLPYLVLPHILSLTWLAYPILSLLFVAFRLQISAASAQDSVISAKAALLASCKAAERASSSAASMPRYMAQASNVAFAATVNGTIRASRATLMLSLTVMEAIINFIIDLYRSTFLCFLELVVRGGLSIIIGATKEVQDFIQNTAGALAGTIRTEVSNANSVIQSAVDGFNKVNPFNDVKIAPFDIPSLSGLENMKIPTTFLDSLTKLNSTIPTVDQLKGGVQDIINTPFDLLKKEINETFSGLTFDSKVLNVPEKNTLSFCADMDTSVIDEVGRDLAKSAKIGVIICIALAVLLTAGNCLWEWYRWRCLKQHLEYTRQAWLSDPTMYHSAPPAPVNGVTEAPRIELTDHNLMMLQSNAAHPLVTRIVNNLSRLLRLSPSKHTHLQWYLSYITHPPAIACLLIGVIGLLSIQVQLFAISGLQNKFDSQAQASSQQMSSSIAQSMNTSMYAQSEAYATDVNGRVDVLQQTINQGVFGWVNTTTVGLNTTINGFYTEVENAVDLVFKGTILENPAREFLRCILGTKVDAIENALTFLHDNLKIDMPRMNNSALVMSPESVQEASEPIAQAAIGGGDDNKGGIVGRLVASYVAGLKKERIMFAVFICLWGVVCFMGIFIILWNVYGRKMVEAKKRRYQAEQRSLNGSGFVVPYRVESPLVDEKAQGGLRSFTRMPAPPTFSVNPFDKDVSEKPQPTPITASQRLMALGKRFANSKGPDRGISNETYNLPPVTTTPQQPSWATRIATALTRQPHGPGHVTPFPSSSPPPPPLAFRGSRPNLTIAVDRSSDVPAPQPMSAWSASPTGSKPWLSSTASSPPKKDPAAALADASWKARARGRPPGLPSHPGASRAQARNVPTSVDSQTSVVAGRLSPQSAVSMPTPQASAPIPIHHGFDQRASSARLQTPLQPSAPPPPKPTSRRSFPPADETPVTRLLTTTHVRQSSTMINPFMGPFDSPEDAKVASVSVDAPRYRRQSPTNPFLAL